MRTRIGVAFLVLGLVLIGITGVLSGDALQALADRLALQLDTDMAIRDYQVQQLASLQALLPAASRCASSTWPRRCARCGPTCCRTR